MPIRGRVHEFAGVYYLCKYILCETLHGHDKQVTVIRIDMQVYTSSCIHASRLVSFIKYKGFLNN